MMRLTAYGGVMVTALVPWFELFVIAPGIALGLQPALVGLLAWIGNLAGTLAVIFGWERFAAWRERRTGRRPALGSLRSARAQQALDRFGVPGLALQGPVITGMYLAVIAALGLGASRTQLLVWSVISITAWTIGLVAATLAGVELMVR